MSVLFKSAIASVGVTFSSLKFANGIDVVDSA